VCASLFEPVGTGEACEYINVCTEGNHCALNNSPTLPTGLVCGFGCDAGGGTPGCDEGPGLSYTCIAISVLYGGDWVVDDPDWGLCVPPEFCDEFDFC
jgi:hypothetical protein